MINSNKVGPWLMLIAEIINMFTLHVITVFVYIIIMCSVH